MKTFRLIALILIALWTVQCSDQNNKNYLWLVGLVQTTANTGVIDANAASPNLGPSTNPAPDGKQSFSITVNDAIGTGDFLFDTTRTVELSILVKDLTSTPATGALVKFIDPSTGNVIFKAITSTSGNCTGNFTVNATTNEIELEVSYNDLYIKTTVDIKAVYQINRTFQMIATSTPIVVVDSDKDGIPDKEDTYPDDPTRATMISYPDPTTKYYTISFEDLYPKQGDADFNDFVVQVRFEEDLNAKGEVARVRTYARHIAKGAGYNHIPRLTLSGILQSNYSLKTFSDTGVLESNISTSVSEFKGIDLMTASNTTISSSNTAKNQTLKGGKSIELEVIPTTPISKITLGAVPYDFYIYVINTKQEIHFAGKYYKTDGKDQYIDTNGFPWAIMIPGIWKWPYEKGNIHNAYQLFDDWYMSEGKTNADWYKSPDLLYVFPSME